VNVPIKAAAQSRAQISWGSCIGRHSSASPVLGLTRSYEVLIRLREIYQMGNPGKTRCVPMVKLHPMQGK
jgi:hypothetical protein